jgi:hypothetical protein
MPDLATAHSLAPLVTEAAKTIEDRLRAEL